MYSQMDIAKALLIPLGFILFGIWVVRSDRRQLRLYRSSDTWQIANAKVISSHLDQDNFENSNRYWPKIVYEYEALGQSFRGDRVRFGKVSSHFYQPAQDIVDQHPPGREITIYYDPDDPENSVIERTMDVGNANCGIFCGSLFICIGIAVTVFIPYLVYTQ